MTQKAKDKVARSAPKKPATRAPKPKKKKAVAASAERVSAAISREQRQAMVAEAAYFMAERRGFAGGDPELDWREAEAEINALLQR